MPLRLTSHLGESKSVDLMNESTSLTIGPSGDVSMMHESNAALSLRVSDGGSLAIVSILTLVAGVILGVGTSAGVASVSGIGASTYAAAGSSAGAAAGSGVGGAIAAAAGTSAGSAASVAGAGAAIFAGDGASDGVGSVAGVGAATFAAAGASAGVASVSGVGSEAGSAEGAGSAAGIASVSGIGAATFAATGASDGIAAGSGVGATTSAGDGASDGLAAASGIGSATAASDGASDGVASVSGIGAATFEAAGASDGLGAVSGIGAAIFAADGSSDGVGTVSGIGAATSAGDGASDGVATVAGTGAATSAAAGSSDGAATVTGDGAATAAGDGSSAGVATVSGVGDTAGEDYSIGGNDPELVADFVEAYYRKNGGDSTFSGVLSFSRASTATYIDSNGELATAASGDERVGHYKYNGSSWINKGILLESEARTNKSVQSEDMTASPWLPVVEVDVTSNQATGPDGATSLDKMECNTSANGGHYVRDPSSNIVTANTVHTMSCFVRDGDIQFVDLWAFGKNNHWATVTFDVANGTVTQEDTGSSSGTIYDSGVEDFSGGLYRIWMVFEIGSISSGPQIALHLVDSGTPSHDITGRRITTLAVGDHVFWGFWGTEEGDSLTSYIPTSGSTVTRAAEVLTSPSANHAPSTTALSLNMKGEINYTDQGAAAQQTFLRWQSDGSNYISWDLDTDGADAGEVNANQAQGGTVDTVVAAAEYSEGPHVAFNIAARHEDGEINLAKDGTAATADTTPTALVDLSAVDLEIGYDFVGTIELLRVWEDVGLTDAQLETAST